MTQAAFDDHTHTSDRAAETDPSESSTGAEDQAARVAALSSRWNRLSPSFATGTRSKPRGDEAEDAAGETAAEDASSDDAALDETAPGTVETDEAARTGADASSGSVHVAAAAEPTLADATLTITGLSKRYGDAYAVRDLDLTLREGEFWGLVGANGAGKTTTLEMVAGLLKPSAGTIDLLGAPLWRKRKSRSALGVLPDRLRSFDRLTGAQFLQYSGRLYGMKARRARERSDELLAKLDVHEHASRLVGDFSTGMLKKFGLAAALMHEPRLLVLDEPFEGVDPVSAEVSLRLLDEFTSAGGTVFLSSHSMRLLQDVASHVAILHESSLLVAGTVEEIRGSASLEDRFVDLVSLARSGSFVSSLGQST